MKTYPVVDRLTKAEAKRFHLQSVSGVFLCHNIKAIATGEKRPPKAGEWYLSGAEVEAYRAYRDLDTPLHIAKLVKVERKTKVVERIVQV